jgi:hypothetical protein
MFKWKINMYRNKLEEKNSWRSEHPGLDPFHVQKISLDLYGKKKIVFKLGFIVFKMTG